MKSVKDLIKKDLEAQFEPKFQKNDMMSKPAGAPKPPSAGVGAPKTPKTGTSKVSTSAAPKPPAAPKAPSASGNKSVGNPTIPAGSGMNKTSMNEQVGDKYHIYQDGKKITDDSDTVTLGQIKKEHGSVQSFEGKGFRLIPVDKNKHRKSEAIFNEIMGAHIPVFMKDIKELAKSNPLVALAALPANATLSKASTKHVIAGEHIPDDRGTPPKSKKIKGNKDEGSGGSATELEKDVIDMKTRKKIGETDGKKKTDNAPDRDKMMRDRILNGPKRPSKNDRAGRAVDKINSLLGQLSSEMNNTKDKAGSQNNIKLVKDPENTKKDEIPANKEISPVDRKEALRKLKKCGEKKILKSDDKVIGKTRSGKPVYLNPKHPSHASFTQSDIEDDADIRFKVTPSKEKIKEIKEHLKPVRGEAPF